MRKRILLMIKGLGRGGAEQLLVNAAPYLDTENFDYRVGYILPWKDALVRPLEERGLRSECLAGAHRTGWIARLGRLVVDERIDLVHTHSPYVAVGARSLLRLGHTRLVHTEHNVWESYARATYWGNLLTYFRNNHVFVVSDHVRESIKFPRLLGRLPRPPIETLYHGPDPRAAVYVGDPNEVRREFGIDPDAPIVGTVANLKRKKGYRYLLQAATLIRREVPNVRFLLVGQGPEEQYLRQQARRLRLDRTVIFAGHRDDVARIVAAFDVFALPSMYEGLSIALIEAMSLGKPSVVTRTGGVPEVVHDGREAFIVQPADSAALAGRIVTLLQDPILRSAMGEAAIRRAADFDIRKAVARSEDVYGELLR
jgi:glycosyltransferase involved in cell wall biosynthesis